MDTHKIKIEKGKPFPNRPRIMGKWTLLFKEMEIGDSFVVPTFKDACYVRSSVNRLGFKISSMAEGDHYRIWLIGNSKYQAPMVVKEGE